MNNLVAGVLWGIVGQVLSFIQLQGGVKWGWTQKYGIAVMFIGLPISWAFMKSVHNFILAFDGAQWPSRLIGFGIGVVVFTALTWILFKEVVTLKTSICLFLALCIILVQILWK